MEPISYKPIGVIHTPFVDQEGMPIQPSGGSGIQGYIELYPDHLEGLKDLDGFSHILLIYHFHRSSNYTLSVKPFLDHEHRGVFATRAPRRPNPIGISVVRLEKIEGTTLHISNVDIVDSTPLLDIKPCVPDFDCLENVRIGWLAGRANRAAGKKSDERFK